jgi:hypothetical protein
MFGGFRSKLIFLLLVVILLFFLEGLHKTRLLPAAAIGMVLIGTLTIGFAQHLPLSLQRSLSWLPIPVDPVVRMDVQGSNEWRLNMWRDLLQEMPHYLLLGKGVSVSQADLDMADTLAKQGHGDTAEVAMLAGDFHSGPFSVVIPFGIWGVIGWFWLIAAGFRALYLNFRHGDPEFEHINTFLFAYFVAKVIMFHVVFGDMRLELMVFAGILGFSVSLNGGIRKPVEAPDTQEALDGPLARPRLLPSFSRLTGR